MANTIIDQIIEDFNNELVRAQQNVAMLTQSLLRINEAKLEAEATVLKLQEKIAAIKKE